jgi:hypothetical protein
MKKSPLALAAGLLVGLVSTGHAQFVPPPNGYVGVYADPAGTQCCITAAAGQTTAYVIAQLGGGTINGITQAEFRIEVSNATGYFFNWAADAGASVNLGNPVDTDPSRNDQNVGLNVAWAECRPNPIGPQWTLGTLTIINLGTGGPTELRIKRHERPSSTIVRAPLFVLCDAPEFTKAPMTEPEPEGAPERVAFTSYVNDPTCTQDRCVITAVDNATWSGMKELYR